MSWRCSAKSTAASKRKKIFVLRFADIGHPLPQRTLKAGQRFRPALHKPISDRLYAHGGTGIRRILLLICLVLSACAKPPEQVAAEVMPASSFSDRSCRQLASLAVTKQAELAELETLQRERLRKTITQCRPSIFPLAAPEPETERRMSLVRREKSRPFRKFVVSKAVEHPDQLASAIETYRLRIGVGS